MSAVLLLSAATLAYEILLLRVFAIEHFHHLAYMAISVAMLGFGAAGTLVALGGAREERAASRWFVRTSALAALSLVAVPALVDRVTLDLTQLAWAPAQWARLGVVYLLLTLPFALTALATLLALRLDRDRPGAIYGASFAGAGVGALLALVILWLAFPTRALAIPALVAAVGGALAAYGEQRRTRAAAGLAAVALAVAVVAVVKPLWQLDVSPYKALAQVEAYPGARRVAERTSPLGWVVAVSAAAFRHAPGLSLAYAGDFPPQTALFVDGEIAGAATIWPGDDGGANTEILDWLPTSLPYALGGRERVLVLGAGGGTDVWSALAHGARRVVAVELNPQILEVSRAIAPIPSRTTSGAEVAMVTGDARSYVARSREQFDLISLGIEGAHGAGAGGIHSLNEDFLHSTDAYMEYLERLSEGGVLAVTRWVTVPPRASIRVILTAAQALRRVQPEGVERGLVVVRSWGTATVLVKPSGFTASELDRLRVWATERSFDVDWHPGIESPSAGFNALEEPWLFRAARAAVFGADSARRFAADYPFEVLPVSDARPYPHHFLRASSLATFVRAGTGTWLPFAEWGYIALVATLAQSALLAAAILIVPAVVGARLGARRRRADALGARPSHPEATESRHPSGQPGLWPLSAYFAAIGVAYMAAEIAAIQQLSLLLGHPVYAVAAVLATLLVFSGAGSVWSDRVGVARARLVVGAIAGVLVIYALALLGLVHAAQGTPLFARAALALVVLAPVAFLMGAPFPLGLRSLTGGNPPRMAWAWAVNGFASVVGAPLAALVALETGSAVLFLVGAVGYAGAGVVGHATSAQPPATPTAT